MSGTSLGSLFFDPVVVSRRAGRPANGPLVTSPWWARKSSMSAFVIAT
jgi:hypothetical protein